MLVFFIIHRISRGILSDVIFEYIHFGERMKNPHILAFFKEIVKSHGNKFLRGQKIINYHIC